MAKKKEKRVKPTNPANLSQKNDQKQVSLGLDKRGGRGTK